MSGKKTKVIYTRVSKKRLRKIDSKQAKRIVAKVAEYTKTKPLDKAKALSKPFEGLYRYRVGDYRVIFQYEEKRLIIVTIMTIKHRKDAYK